MVFVSPNTQLSHELRQEKTDIRGFRPGPIQTRLYNHRRWQEALNFGFYEVQASHYPCSENNGTDQLCGYRETDLRLCFRLCKIPTRLILL